MSRADPTPSPSQAPSHPPPIHKRTYQACIPCRERKVRCDLGSVEAPSDPPCVRCRRESKECFFSATRRKTRTPTEEPTLGRGRGALRRKHQGDQAEGPVKRPRSIIEPSPGLIDPRLGAVIDVHAAVVSDGTIGGDSDDDGGGAAADALLRAPVHNSHEALLTLIEAAGKDTLLSIVGQKSGGSPGSDTEGDGEGGEQEARHHNHNSQPQHHHPHPHHHHPHHHNHHLQSPIRTTGGVRFSSMTTEGNGNDVAGGSSFASSHAYRRNSTTSPGMLPARSLSISTGTIHEAEGIEKALRVWNKFRFVKAGWFTAREAIDYVEYFYKHLHPLSPTLTSPSLQYISHPSHHPSLLRQEPFLTTIILLITSRYKTLTGPGGLSRSYVIHDMLWREVRGGCEGLMWGGGWGGVGTPGSARGGLGTSASSNAKVARGLRTLGTVEGLLILTEWHVRGLHFPMDVEGGDWMVDSSDTEGHSGSPPSNRTRRGGGAKAGVVEGLSDQIKNILEPAYRSDRMSWMLLGNALALAYELGVFDEIDEPAASTTLPSLLRDGIADTGYRLRFQRIQKLLLVYVLQLASRLGWTSMIPLHITSAVRHKLSSQAASPTSSNGQHWPSQDDLQDVIFNTWVDLTMLMKNTAETLFPSRRETKDIMRSGKYVTLLNYFQPLLSEWKRGFEALNLPKPIYFILTMEYEHVRFYVNSLALQAVVDRCTSAAHAPNSNQSSSNNASASASTNNPPLQLLNQVKTPDLHFIKEVVDASRALLSCVVDKMAPPGFLKHAPVRIYLRILGAAMFLLKTFALGAKEEDVNASLSLIHRSIAAMREAAVDDVHLALRFADLLETLTKRIKTRVVRMPAEQDIILGTAPSTSTVGATGEEEREREFRAREREEEFDVYDWLALPVDPIAGAGFAGGVGVTQSQMGVDVGGVDLLELLLAGEGE